MKNSRGIISRLSVGVAQKDEDHLFKYVDFIGYHGTINRTPPAKITFDENKSGTICSSESISIVSTSSIIVPKIAQKLGVSERKTYNPPECLIDAKEDMQMALLIGFIDGDGTIVSKINGRASLTITSYKAWKPILKEFKDLLYTLTPNERSAIRPNKKQIDLSVNNAATLRELNLKALELKLPIMSRKWNRIDTTLKSRKEQKEDKITKIKELLNEGFSPLDISKRTKISRTHMYRLVKEIRSE
jgi:intein/homing endonuclease